MSSKKWGEQLDGRDDAPGIGVSKEMLRKAMKLNPELRREGSTQDVLDRLEQAQAGRKVGDEEPATAASGPVDVASGVRQAKSKYQQDKKRLQAEIAVLQKQISELGPKSLAHVIDVLLAGDPNLASIITNEVIKEEAPFLTEIGFSAKKVLERKARTK